MPDTPKIYKGTMGRFLAQINRPNPEPVLLDVIAEHGDRMALRKRIKQSKDFSVVEILDAMDSLKRRGLIRIERSGQDEIVKRLNQAARRARQGSDSRHQTMSEP